MAKDIKLPELGENIEEAEVLSVLVSEGDELAADQAIAELETDKATVEVPAPFGGRVARVRIAAGDSVRIGQVLIEVETDEAASTSSAASSDDDGGSDEAVGAAADATDTGLDADADETAAAEEEGDEVGAPEPSPSRAAPERPGPAPAPAARAERREPARRAPAREPAPPDARASEGAEAGGDDPAPAAPSVRRLARELGIEVGHVRGSGPGGRISMEDVKIHAREIISGQVSTRGPSQAPTGFLELPDFSQFGEIERQAMTGVRRRTAENMTRSWVTIPHVTQFDRADVTVLEQARKRFAKQVERAGGKLTVTAIVIKALAAALRQFPKFNASLDVENDEIVFKKYVHVGVAVDTEYGLLVPVIRDVDRKSLTQIGTELTDLSERARKRKIRPDDLRGASLTVTNLGGLGTTHFTPLINWPEVAVLGIGRANHEAVLTDGGFAPHLILPLSISYDHRLIDGADAARFLRWLCESLESPIPIVLEGP